MNNTTNSIENAGASILPTAEEVALAKSEFSETPTTAEFWKRLHDHSRLPHGQPYAELDAAGHAEGINPQVVEYFMFTSQGDSLKVVSPTELDKIVELEAWFKAALAKCAALSPSNAEKDYLAERDRHNALAIAGEELPTAITPSRDAFKADRRLKLQAIVGAMVAKTQNEVLPLVKPILARFETLIREQMEYREVGDRELCVAMGVEYKPTRVWRLAATVAKTYHAERRIPQASAWATPASILEGIVNTK